MKSFDVHEEHDHPLIHIANQMMVLEDNEDIQLMYEAKTHDSQETISFHRSCFHLQNT